MATDRQIQANRRNAKRSTGPRTKAGKARSRYNALKSGLTARTAVPLLGESRQEFEELRDGLFAHLQPKTVIGRELVDELAQRVWQLRRCRGFENAMADVAARQKLAHVMKGLQHQHQAKRKVYSGVVGATASRLSELKAALNDPGLVISTGLQVAAADHMFEFATMAKIEGHQARLLQQIQRLIDQLETVESRYAKNVAGREAQSGRPRRGGGPAKQARELAALAEDRAIEALQAMVAILADPATPPHVRAAIAEKLLARDQGKPEQSNGVTQETTHNLANDFEMIVRALNDRTNKPLQDLQRQKAMEIEVDFSDLDKFLAGDK